MNNKTRRKLIPVVIELIGITTVSVGIGLEMALGGEVYLVMITAGSLLIAAGGLIFAKFMRRG